MKRVCNECVKFGPCTLENNFDYVEPISCPLNNPKNENDAKAQWEEFCGESVPEPEPEPLYTTEVILSTYQLLRVQQIITQIALTGKSGTCVGDADGNAVMDNHLPCDTICSRVFDKCDNGWCPCQCYPKEEVMQRFAEVLDYNLDR